MERTPSGIPGLDELIEKGIPRGSAVLLSGGSGTGKSIFAMQFIYSGAKDYNEPGLYVTLESNIRNIVWDMENFQWDIKPLQDRNLVKIYRLNLGQTVERKIIIEQIDSELKLIASMVKEMGIKRLVIDSTTSFGAWISEEGQLRSMLFKFVDSIKNLNCTTLMTAEVANATKNAFSAYGVEEFISDGVIALYFMPPHRSVFIRKLRGTNHSKTVHPFEITKNGIQIKSKDEIMWEAIK